MSGILVYALHYEGAFNKNSLGAVSEAARLAGELGGEAHAVVVGEGIADDLAATLGKYGATKVIKMDVEDGKLRCERQAEYGYDTVLVELPAVISVGDAINEPRYPSLKAIMGAKKKPLQTLSASDAGIEADRVGYDNARAHCADFAAPPAKEPGRIIEDEDTAETVEQIVGWLEERRLLA